MNARRHLVAGALALAALLGGGAAPAGAWMVFGANTAEQPGQIDFIVWGPGTFSSVEFFERAGGSELPLRTVVPPTVTAPDGGTWSGTSYPGVTQWRCDRLTRYFEAVGHRPDGTTETSLFDIRTPSCRDRLRLIAPRRVKPGRRVVLRVRDSFELGGLAARLCVRLPAGRRACRTLTLRSGHSSVTYALRPRARGRWTVTVSGPRQRLRTVIGVGVAPPRATRLPTVLTTGDSLMQNVDAVLQDRLAGRAQVRSDIHISSGLSKDTPVRWSALPGTQVARFAPAATVVFLGTNDGWPMTTPAGAKVQCCGEPWVAEYARRARRAMKAYLRGHSGAVVWLNIPIAADPRRKPLMEAVNAGVARAATGLGPRAAVLDMAALFTPNGVYRDYMTVGVRRVRVRESDGVHLTPDGAAIAVRAVIARLERLRVL